VRIHGRVEPAVVNDVVHMAIDIVVHPAGLYISEVSVMFPFHWDRPTFLTHLHVSVLSIIAPKFKP
jgi:hypothetical protein